MDDKSAEVHRLNESADSEITGWIEAISRTLGSTRLQIGEQALFGVASVLCDHLSPQAADGLLRQLPSPIRVRCVDEAQPSSRTLAYTRQSFMTMVAAEMEPHDGFDAESVTHAVLKVMSQEINPQAADALRECLPADLQGLWPERATRGANGIWSGTGSGSDG